ncbi:hypothetical protein D3C79_49980 [compost metagenome]
MNNVNNFAAIVEAINFTSGRILDDHHGASGMTVAGIAELVKGDSRIPVVLCRSIYFSLNRLYLDERAIPHVSREAVGGVVKCLDGITLEQGVTNYNAAQVGQKFSCGSLESIHYLVNGKLVPEVTSLEPQRAPEYCEYDAIAAILGANGGEVIDDHTPDNKVRKLAGIALQAGRRGYNVVALGRWSHFSINKLYIDDTTGMVHLSTESTGSVVVGADISLEAAIEKYNADQEQVFYKTGNLTDVCYF